MLPTNVENRLPTSESMFNRGNVRRVTLSRLVKLALSRYLQSDAQQTIQNLHIIIPNLLGIDACRVRLDFIFHIQISE